MRTVVLLILFAGSIGPAIAQPVPQAGDVRPHPTGAEAVLAAQPESDLLIYQAGNSVRFERGGERTTVMLPGELIGFASSQASSHAALLAWRPASDSLLLGVYRADGARQYGVAVPQHRDDPLPQMAVAGTGEAVYVWPERAEVVFLASDGSVQRRVSLFDEAGHSLERGMRVAFSPDGRFVAVAAQREAAHPDRSAAEPNAQLFLFERGGTLRWQLPLSEPAIQALDFLADSLVAVSSFDAYSAGGIRQQSRLFSLDGDQAFEAPVGAESFRADSEGVLLVNKRSVTAYGLPGGRLRFTYKPPRGSQIVSAAASVAAPQMALLVGSAAFTADGFVFEGLRLLHVNPAGAVAGEHDLGARVAHVPIVRLLPGDRSTALVLDEATHFFPWLL